MKKYQIILILATATIVPGGFIALGLWKTYEVYKKKQAEKLAKPKTIEEYIEQLKIET